MTRDRKKCFIATIEKTIDELECDVKRMRDILYKVSSAKFMDMAHQVTPMQVTPMGSPELSAKEGPAIDEDGDDEDDSSVYSQVVVGGTAAKKAKHSHGFSLDD
jgi:hypothetical protein